MKVDPRARVIATMLLGCMPHACVADESERPGQAPRSRGGGASSEVPLMEGGPDQCTIERPVRRISLALAAADSSGALDVDLPAHSNLRVVLGNTGTTDARVVVHARSWGEADETNVAAGVAEVRAGASATLDVEVRSLGLAGGVFENSGSLVLRAEGLFTDGSLSESEPTKIAFHPNADGWVFYDLSTRDSVYDGGALTAAARSARAAAMERLPAGTRLAATARGRTQGHPEGWSPPPDGPPDSDGAGR